MSIIDARHIDLDGEGTELLASVLHQTRRGRARALARGRCRAAEAAKGIGSFSYRPSRTEARITGLDQALRGA
jgi:hypothetical protein